MNVSAFWKNKSTPYLCLLNLLITWPLYSTILSLYQRQEGFCVAMKFALVAYTFLIQKISI